MPEILDEMQKILLQNDVVVAGDKVLFTYGEPIGTAGGTNTLKIIEVK